MPFITSALVAAGVSASTAAAVTTAVISITVSTVLGAAVSILTKPKKPKFDSPIKTGGSTGGGPGGITQMVRQPAATRDLVYGQVRKSGTMAYISTTNNNKFLHIVIMLAAHQCEDIVSVWFDDKKLTWNKSTGAVTAGRFENRAEVFFSLGSDSQTVLPELNANIPSNFTSNHRLRGITYAYVKLQWDSTVYDNIPNISFIIKGKNDILDTRTMTTGYTDNPVLCTLDYLLLDSSRGGVGITDTEYDVTSTNIEANICDELVPLQGGGTEKRYTCNGVVDTGASIQENIEDFLTAMAGKITYRNGKFFLLTGSYRIPTVTITNDDMISDIEVSSAVSRQELFNAVKGLYISAKNDYQPSDFPPLRSETFKAQDNGERIWRDIELNFTNSSAMAQRISKILLLTVRQPITVQVVVNMKGFQLAVGDTVLVDDDELGWSQKTFEVQEWQFVPSSDGLAIQLSLRETDPSVYAFDTSEEQTVDPAPDTNLPSLFTTEAPTGIVLDSGTDQLIFDGGTVVTRIKVNWDVAVDAFVVDGGTVEVEMKKSSDTIFVGMGGVIPGNATEAFLSPVEDGVDYDVRVRFKNSAGIVGEYTTITNHTTIGKTAPPSNVINFAAEQNGAFVTFHWDRIEDLDLAGYDLRIGPENNSTWENARPVTEIIKTNRYTTSHIPAGNHVVFCKAVDTIGNESLSETSFTLTVRQGNFTDDTTLTRSEDHWQGVFDNMLLHAPTDSIVPDSITEGDDADDIFDNANVEYHKLASYTWPEIDLGSDKNVRVSHNLSSRVLAGTSGVADPRLFIQVRSASGASGALTLNNINAINGAGTLTNMVLHHSGSLVPESSDLVSAAGIEDEFVQNALTTNTFESQEFDLGSDVKVNLTVVTESSLGPEEAGTANVQVQLDHRLDAGSFDGFENWASGQFTGRFFKIKLISDSTVGKTVIKSAIFNVDTFNAFSGVGEYDDVRFVQLKVVVDTDKGVANITDYDITVDVAT